MVKLKEKFNINDTFETEIVNIVDFGIFVKLSMKLMEWFIFLI